MAGWSMGKEEVKSINGIREYDPVADFEKKRAEIFGWLSNGAIDELRRSESLVRIKLVSFPGRSCVIVFFPEDVRHAGSCIVLEESQFQDMFGGNMDVVENGQRVDGAGL